MAEETTSNENGEQPIIIKKVIKKGGGHGHHGGAWKVAYADFVTAMMALFMLLWLVNMDPASKSVIADYFKEPMQMGPMTGSQGILGGSSRPGEPGQHDGGASFMQFRKVEINKNNESDAIETIKKEMEAELSQYNKQGLYNQLQFTVTDQGIMVELHEENKKPLFKSGSSVLTEDAKIMVDTLTKVLNKNSNELVISGHTDAAKFGYGSYDNWNLSSDRAQALRKRIVARGVEDKRIAKVEGYGSTQLKVPEAPYSSVNRRLTVLILNKKGKESLVPKKHEYKAGSHPGSIARHRHDRNQSHEKQVEEHFKAPGEPATSHSSSSHAAAHSSSSHAASHSAGHSSTSHAAGHSKPDLGLKPNLKPKIPSIKPDAHGPSGH